MASPAFRWGKGNKPAVLWACLYGALLGLTWAGWLASAVAPTRRLHPDEAFFLTFARHAAVNGDWWLLGALDKPPLAIYAHALAFTFAGVDSLPNGVLTLDARKGEFVGRWLSLMTGMSLLALVLRLSYDLTRRHAIALLVGTMLAGALTPYSASAFMDVPLLAFAFAALVSARRGAWRTAGVWLSLAFAVKPQAIFFAPLCLLWGWQHRRQMGRAFHPLALAGVGLLVWDSLREGTSVFVLGAHNNTEPLRLSLPSLSQLGRVLGLDPASFASAWQACVVALVGALISVGAWRTKGRAKAIAPGAWWALGLVGMHALVGLRWHERYSLLVVPVWAMVGAWGVFHPLPTRVQSVRAWATPLRRILSLWLCAHLLLSVRIAPHDSTPMLALAEHLNAKPIATVVYDRWLGWQLRYYLGQWTDKRLTYYPTPSAWVVDALALRETGVRYFVGLEGENVGAWLSIACEAGFGVALDWHQPPYSVYALTPPHALDKPTFSCARSLAPLAPS